MLDILFLKNIWIQREIFDISLNKEVQCKVDSMLN